MRDRIVRILKRIWGDVFLFGGGFHLCRFINHIRGRRLTIVTYHRITDSDIRRVTTGLPFLFVRKETFVDQISFLKRHYTVITFKDLARLAGSGDRIPRNSLIITFDDGYSDNYDPGYRILREHRLPATFFLTVNRIGSPGALFWWDRAYHLFHALSNGGAASAGAGCGPGTVRPDPDLASYLRSFEDDPSGLFSRLNLADTRQIDAFLDKTRDSYGIDEKALARDNAMLDWDHVDEMKQEMEFGSHTCNHPNLNELSGDLVEFELGDSRKRLAGRLGGEVVALSYPAGNVSGEVIDAAKRAGYRFAVTTERGINDLRDPYRLKRINVWEGTSGFPGGRRTNGYFAFKLTGH